MLRICMIKYRVTISVTEIQFIFNMKIFRRYLITYQLMSIL